MPLAFHYDRDAKYRQQYENAEQYIVPFIEAAGVDVGAAHVLEIGCGEGGVLLPFLERGGRIVGIDPNAGKVAHAEETMAEAVAAGRAAFHAADVYDPEIRARYAGAFDVVLLKDTIEHIYGHERLLRLVLDLLAPGGLLFVAFPPWRMPYGGHQQMANTKLGKLPYYHMLPRPLYRGLLRLFGEDDERIRILMEVYDTRLSIRRFETLLGKCGYETVRRQFYLINPIYRYKFGLTPRVQLPVVRSLPWVRDFVTTTCYYLVRAR